MHIQYCYGVRFWRGDACTEASDASAACVRRVCVLVVCAQLGWQVAHYPRASRGRREVTEGRRTFHTGCVLFTIVVCVGWGAGWGPLYSSRDSRPFCQRAASQSSATTCNVNLYVSKRLSPDAWVNLLDFEGENGSEVPVMAAARGSSGGTGSSGRAGDSSASRHKAVAELFPKMAYMISDVVVVVCREPFYNRYAPVKFTGTMGLSAAEMCSCCELGVGPCFVIQSVPVSHGRVCQAC